MVEEQSERRRAKTHARNNNLRHSISSTTRLGKHKAGQGFARGQSATDLISEGGGEQPPRFLRTNSRFNMRPKQKKPVIQLERSDSDENEDFVDVDSGDESTSAPSESIVAPQTDLSSIPAPRLNPSEPMISNETVVSLSDVASAAMRTRQRVPLGSFIDESDFVSSAVIGADDDDIKSIFGEQSSRTVGNLTRQKGRREPSSVHHASGIRERDRVNERVFKQYFNITNIHNPVIESISRVQQARIDDLSLAAPQKKSHPPPITSPLADRTVRTLTATSTSQLDDPDTDDITYLLNKMWQEGWMDPNATPQQTPPNQTPQHSRRNSANNIGAKARWAAQRLSSGNLTREKGIKLG